MRPRRSLVVCWLVLGAACGRSGYELAPTSGDQDTVGGDTDTEGDVDPLCAGVTCSGHGSCAVTANGPTCTCDIGYEARGTSCVLLDCTPTTRFATACDVGDVYWYDSCGLREELLADCGVWPCEEASCLAPSGWQSVGSSAFSDHAVRATWGSSAGVGLTPDAGGVLNPAIAALGDGTYVFAYRRPGAIRVFVESLDGLSRREQAPGSATAGIGDDARGALAVSASGANVFLAFVNGAGLGGAAGYGDTFFDGSTWSVGDRQGFSDPVTSVLTATRGTARFSAVSFEGVSTLTRDAFGVSFEEREPSITIDSLGRNVLATVALDGRIFVRRSAGTAWGETSAGSASGSGVNGAGSEGTLPCVRADGNGGLVLAWRQDQAVFVLRYDDANGWQEVGSGSASGTGVTGAQGNIRQVLVAVDGADRPIIAWRLQRADVTQTLMALRWSGTAWTGLDGSEARDRLGGTRNVGEASIAVGSDGQPVLAWPSDQYAYAVRYNGVSWGSLMPVTATGGGLSDSPTLRSTDPRIAHSVIAGLIAAWRESGAGASRLSVRRWNGAAFIDLAFPTTFAAISEPALAVMDDGWPILAWAQSSGMASEIFAMRFNGSQWVALGSSVGGAGISNTASGSSSAPCVTGGANPTVFWVDSFGGIEAIYARRWDGVAWAALAGSTSGDGVSTNTQGASTPACAEVNGQPTVAWADGLPAESEIHLRQWNGSAWVELGGSASAGGVSASPATASLAPAIAADADGLAVAWTEAGKGIYLRRWNGASWVELGGSATAGGISGTALAAGAASVTYDGSALWVAWSEDSLGWRDIAARRWSVGSGTWESVSGSAGPGGVSNNQGPTGPPSIARIAAPPAVCVSWSVLASDAEEVALRCHAVE